MDWNKYEAEAMVTVNKKLNKDERLANACLGLTGELGEVVDIIKKHLYQGHKLDEEHIAEELGDVCWYLALLTNTLDINLVEVLQDNIDKLRGRYKEGFTSKESIYRGE